MMQFNVELDFRGLCCFVRRRDGNGNVSAVTVLLPNVTDPPSLSVPTGVVAGAIETHRPSLAVTGAVGGDQNLAIFGCDVTLSIPDAVRLDDRGLEIQRLDLLATDTGGQSDRARWPHLLSGNFLPAHPHYSLLASRIAVESGVFDTDYRAGAYKFAWLANPAQQVAERVVVRTPASGPVVIERTSRANGGINGTDAFHAADGDTLVLRFGNEESGNPGRQDFLAYYNLLKNPAALRRLPYPIVKTAKALDPPPGGDAQCSPVEHP